MVDRRFNEVPVFVAPQCASCGKEDLVELYYEPDVGFCAECLAQGHLDPDFEEFDDLGVGD